MGKNKEPKRYMVTAALPYVNGPVHIGHLAGVYIPSDIYVRYLRKTGKDVVFVCGSDEHGVPITIRARKEGVSPQDVVDKYHKMVKESFSGLGVSFDHYSSTSGKMHYKTASDFFLHLEKKGEFVEQSAEQYFDEEAGQYLADRYITGTCPKCGHDGAYGDQCESCGSSLSPIELIDPKSTLSGSVPVLRETRHWYLPLDRYQEEFLGEWISKKRGVWRPNVYGQCMSWLDGGLRPRAVTRDLDWGIPVPVEGAEGKVLYVWFDAPIGYISATKEYFDELEDPDGWKPYWQDEGTRLVHFIGKDNIVFHCIIFPSMLHAHGDYILPEAVPANEFLNLEGQKISTSRNWAVWLHEYLEDFPGKEDVLRYVLTANAPESKDNDFTWKDFQDRNNSELVAILGNFINRVAVLTHKYYEGVVPEPDEYLPEDTAVLKRTKHKPRNIGKFIEQYKFREGLQELMDLARIGNKYLADQEPWKKIKEDPDRVRTVMYIALQISGALAILCEPFLPFTSRKLYTMLGMKEMEWDKAGRTGVLYSGHQIEKAKLLFSKIEDAEIKEQLEKLEKTRIENAPETKHRPMKDIVAFDDFMKMDIRTAVILEAERVPKTDKLLQLKVDTGLDQRTIVSGIAEYFAPEDIVGKEISVLMNLEPRKIRGVISQGMVLMAENEKGELAFVVPEKKFDPGCEIR